MELPVQFDSASTFLEGLQSYVDEGYQLFSADYGGGYAGTIVRLTMEGLKKVIDRAEFPEYTVKIMPPGENTIDKLISVTLTLLKQ